MKVFKKSILLIVCLLTICLVGCKKELPEPNEQGISATNLEIERALQSIIVDSSYKRLTNNLRLPLKADGKYLIKWTVSESDYVYIQMIGEDSVLKVTRPESEYTMFTLTAEIEDSKGREYGVRTWTCYIAPKIYKK